MAHPNCLERQEAITALYNEGVPFTKELKKTLSIFYGCSMSAIYSDLWQLQLKGTLTGPSPLEDTVFVTCNTRKEVLKRDNYTCQYCGKTDGKMIVEHVIPYKMGGFGREYNLVAACNKCNMMKGSTVWIPNNIDILGKLSPSWKYKILSLAVTPHHRRTLRWRACRVWPTGA